MGKGSDAFACGVSPMRQLRASCPLWRTPLSPAVWFIPTAGRDTIPWKERATGTVSLSEGTEGIGVGLAAARSSGSLAVEALAVGHLPRCGQPGAPRLLPG